MLPHTRVILEFNEHDTLQLMRLIQREMSQTDKAWLPYWQRILNKMERSLDRASFRAFQYRYGYKEHACK
ncbi:MAG: hypothetical protein D6784_06710 [Chloroflexi bacterium]|nr:MAG: hypothetical protein D6784_06710 [Chloroflexota bacterium]